LQEIELHLTCHCAAAMRIIAMIDGAEIIERILKHLNIWEPMPRTISSPGPDPQIDIRFCAP